MPTDISFKIAEDSANHRFNYRVAAIVEVGGKILIHRFVDDSFSFLPGGRVQLGETTHDAIIRELAEELGIKASVSGLPLFVENFFDHKGERFHEVGLYFTVDGNGLQLPADGEIRDGMQFFWRAPDDLADLNLLPSFLAGELRNLPATTKHVIHINR